MYHLTTKSKDTTLFKTKMKPENGNLVKANHNKTQ